MSVAKTGDYVNIGDEVGHVEEYLSDDLTTFIVDGKIVAASAGYVSIDDKKRLISINNYTEEKRIIPKVGDVIIGTIMAVRKHSVGVKIQTLNNRLVLDTGLSGNIHVSQVSRQYVDKLENYFQKTDIVRAKVIRSSGSEWDLATNAMNTGVILSECKFCGHNMERKGRSNVICSFCGNNERKILAPDFNMINDPLKF